MLTDMDYDQDDDKGWKEGNIRGRNTGEPLLRIAGDPILDDLLIVETGADDEGGEKGEKSEDCVGDNNPTGGERDGGKLVVCVAWHEL